MKFSIQSLFRKVKPAESLEIQTALPHYSPVIRAMSLLTASVIFLQGPLALAAVIDWNPTLSSGTFSTQVGGTWSSGGMPGSSDTAKFNLFTSDYSVLIDGSRSVDGLATFNLNGTAGTTVILTGSLDGTSILQLGTAGIQTTAGSLRLDSALTVTLGGAQTWTVDGATALTVAGTLNGTGSLTKDGAGLLSLETATTSYTGDTTVLAGTVNAGTLSGTTVLAVSGGTLNVGSYNTSATLSVSNDGIVNVLNADLTLAGTVTNNATSAGSVNFLANTGTITLSSLAGSGATLFNSAANIAGTLSSGSVSVFGLLTAVDISGGTVSVGSLAATGIISGGVIGVASGPAVMSTVSGGTLNLNGPSGSVATLNGGSLNLSGATTLTVSAGDSAGTINGAGALIKDTSATLTLSGANTYTGSTTVSGGSLNVAPTGSLLSTGTLIVLSGASANFLASVATIGSISGAGATVFAGTGTVTSALAEGTVNFGGDAHLSSVSGANVSVNGSASLSAGLGAGALTLNSIGNYVGNLTGGSLTLNSGAVAEGYLFSNGNVTNSGSLVIRGAGSTFSGLLSGAGTLVFADSSQTLGGTLSGFTGTYGSVEGSAVGFKTETNAAASLVISGSSGAWLMTNGGSIGAVSVSADSAMVLGAGTYTLGTIAGDAGSFVLGGGTFTLGSLTGSGTVANVVASPTILKVGALNTSTEFSGTLTEDATNSAGSLSLVKVGAGTLTLSGPNTFTGTTTVNAGTLITIAGALGSTVSIGVNGATLNAVDYNSAATLTVDASGFATISGTDLSLGAVINANTSVDSVSFTSSSGTITLAGLSGAGNTRFTNDATITAGGIIEGTVNVAGLLTSDISGGEVNAGSLRAVSVSGGMTGITDAASILTLSGGVNTVGGIATVTTVSDGTLNLNGPSGSVATLNGGTLNLSVATTLTVSAGDSAGTINGDGALIKDSSATLTLSGANTFSGSTTVEAGTLTLASGGSLASAVVGVNAGAILNASGNSPLSIATVLTADGVVNLSSSGVILETLLGSGTVNLTSTVLTVQNGNFSGAVNDGSTAGSLVKTSTGLLTLSGLNGYTGQTSVQEGTLTLGSGGTLTSTAVNVSAGATLNSEVDSQLSLATVLTADGVVNLSNPVVALAALSGSGTVTLNSTELTVQGGTFGGSINEGGAIGSSLVKTGVGELTLSGLNGYTGATSVVEGSLTLASGGTLSGFVVGVSAGATLNSQAGSALSPATLLTADGVVNLFNTEVALMTLLGSGTVNLDTTALTVQGGTFTGAIKDGSTPGSLVKTSPETLILSGASTYTGGTSLNEGTLSIGHNLALGAGTLNVADGATLDAVESGLSLSNNLGLNGTLNYLGTNSLTISGLVSLGTVSGINVVGNALTLTGTVSGDFDFTKSGAGTLTVNGNNTSTAATIVTGGSLILGASGSLATGSLTVSGANTVLDLGETHQLVSAIAVTDATVRSGTLEGTSFTLDGAKVSAKLAGTGALTSTGNTTLSAENSLTGPVTVNSGTLSIGAGGTVGSLSNAASFSVASGATLQSNRSNDLDLTQVISGEGSLVKDGAGTTILSGGNTYSGGTSVKAGTLIVSGSLAAGSDLTVAADSFANLAYASAAIGRLANGGSVNFTVATGTVSVATLTGAGFTGFASNLAVDSYTGSGTLSRINGGSGTLILTTFNGTGVTTLSGDTTITNLNGGSINQASTGTLFVSAGNSTGVISGAASLVKNGGTTLILAGANTYTGSTTVKAGLLDVTGSIAVGSTLKIEAGGARFANAATLDVVINSGLLGLAAGSSINTITSTGTLTHTGGLTISGAGSIASLSGGASSSFTKSGTGTLTLGGIYLGTTSVTGGTLSLNAGARLNGDVTVSGGRLLLGDANQFGGNLTLASGIIDLGGNSQLLAGSFTATGGMLGVVGETGTLTASAVNVSGGTMNVTPKVIALTAIGSSAAVLPELSLSGTSSTPVTLTVPVVYVEAVKVSGSNQVLVLTGTDAAPSTTALSISGNNNTVQFTQGFAPTKSVELTVGGAGSTGSVLKVGGEGLVLARGKLSGRGTIEGNVRLGTGSNFAPGNSPGVMTIVGNLALNGATLSIEFDRTAPIGDQQDQVVVTGGAVTINGGTLSLNLGTGASRFRPGVDQFNPIFISSGSAATVAKLVGGTGFSTLIAPAGFGFSLVDGLLVLPNSGLTSGFSRIGASGNLAAVGSLVDRAFSAGINSSTIGAGSLGALMDNTSALASANKATVASTLAALNPAVYAELGNIGIDRLHDVQAGLSNHLDMLALDAVGEPGLSLGVRVAPPQPQSAPAASAVERARAWTTAYGGWGKRNSDSGFGAAGYSSSNYGDVSGVESKIGDFTIGLTGAVGHSSATFQDGKGSVTADSWHTGVYGSFPAGRLVLDASFVYGQADSTLKRSVDVAGGGATSGKSQGSEWTGQAGFAVPFRTDGDSLMITPSVHVIHASVEQDAITESSLNGLEAAVKGASTTATALRTGVQAAKLTTLGTIATRLTASLDWVHSFDSGRNDVDIALTGAGAETSRFQSSKAGKDAIRFGLGAEFALTDRIRFRLNVDDQVKSGVNSVYSSASIGLQF